MEELLQSLREYPSSDRVQFEEVLRRLMAECFLVRDDESDRRAYAFVLRRFNDVASYLGFMGWEVLHHERLHVIQLLHKEGAHRRKFTKDQTSWLLLIRLLYAEQKESMKISLVRNPVVRVSEVFERFTRYFPGENVRRKTALMEALRMFHSLKLLRLTETRFFSVSDPETPLELLPTLEIALPASKLQEIEKRMRDLASQSRARDHSEDETEE